jgi:hypothetical protein
MKPTSFPLVLRGPVGNPRKPRKPKINPEQKKLLREPEVESCRNQLVLFEMLDNARESTTQHPPELETLKVNQSEHCLLLRRFTSKL